MNRTLAAVLTGSLVVVGVAAPSATAAPKKKKPISKSYTATAPTPDPTNFAMQGYSVCAQNVPQSFHTEIFKVPAAGTLKVELKGYVGDWDLLLMDGNKEEIANSGLTDVQGAPEVAQVKFKKPTTVHIVMCNWAGGPTGQGSYVFTYK